MNHSLTTGFSFGLTSGVITTMGLMVGLQSGTQSKLVVIGGILTIAIADAFSDALGIHISEESENKHTAKQIWQSTFATFLAKFSFASTFVLPILLLDLITAVWINIFWGLLVLAIFSYGVGKRAKRNPWKVVREHLTIAVLVILITHLAGSIIKKIFS